MTARPLLAAACVLLLTDCGWLARRRSARAERAMAIASVFETPHPYSARRLEDRDFARFFAAHTEYLPDSEAIADFYERRNGQSAWMLGDSLSASAESFIAFAGTADSTAGSKPGFSPQLIERYEQSASGNAASSCDGCANDLELHLTAEFFRFAARKYGGYLSRDEGELDWFIPRAKKDSGRLLDSLATGTMDLSPYEPIHPQYRLLKLGIARYRAVASEPWPALELPHGRHKLVSGDSAAIIGVIRHRLRLLGDSKDDGAGERYDTTMDAPVRSFQARHGVQVDGVIGPSFLREMNVPVSDRLRTMLVNIERLRWVPEAVPSNVLQVNIPEFRLHVFEGGKEVLGMAVVVGARATHTVVFSDTMSQIVFSPGWTLPPTIMRNEVLPKMRKDANYLASHDMEIVGGSSDNPLIRQRPGPRNPLGGVKFLFPNSYDIYMHDTPSQSLFAQDDRAGSHGCIRLSHPADLAAYLLRADPQWTAESIRAAMTSGTERTVQLRERHPVTIGYFTAWVDPEGRLNFREDVYGHDAKLARELFVQ